MAEVNPFEQEQKRRGLKTDNPFEAELNRRKSAIPQKAKSGLKYPNPEGLERYVAQGAEAVIKGGAALGGLPVDLFNLGAKGVDWLGEVAGVPEKAWEPKPVQTMSSPFLMNKARDLGVIDNPHLKPTSTAGEYANKAVEGAAQGAPWGLPGILGGATSSMAHKFAVDNKMGTTAEVIASILGGIGGGRLPATLERTGKTLAGKTSNLVDDYVREGIKPRLAGDVTGRNALQRLQNAAADTLTGGGNIKRAAEKTIEETAEAVERAAKKYGRYGTVQQTGASIIKGAENWLGRFKGEMNRAYKKVDYHYKKTDQVNLSRTNAALDDLKQAMPDAPNTAKQFIGDFFNDLKTNLSKDMTNGKLSYQSVKRLRTEIGQKLANPQIMDDIDRAALKKLYGALSDDIVGSAKNEHAVRRLREANDVARKGFDQLETTYQNILKKGITPEQVYQHAIGNMGHGGTRLAKIREGFTDNEWSMLAATVLKRMGQAKGGAQNAAGDAFSPATYLTNWNKNISPEAKRALFGKGEFGDMPASLDRLARITESMKNTQKIANASKTAGTAEIIRLLTLGGGGSFVSGGAGFVVGAGTSLITPWTVSKLMTSPSFVRWLSVPISLKQLPKRAVGLLAVANADPSIETEVRALKEQLSSNSQ